MRTRHKGRARKTVYTFRKPAGYARPSHARRGSRPPSLVARVCVYIYMYVCRANRSKSLHPPCALDCAYICIRSRLRVPHTHLRIKRMRGPRITHIFGSVSSPFFPPENNFLTARVLDTLFPRWEPEKLVYIIVIVWSVGALVPFWNFVLYVYDSSAWRAI